MRSVQGEDGRGWDVTVGRESWGALVLLFAAREGREFRVAPLAAETARQAELELAGMPERDLQDLLAASRPWEG